MKPAKYDLMVYQGADLDDEFIIELPDGTPWDLTGYTGRSQIRESYTSSSYVVEMTTENGYLVLGDDAGTVAFNVPGDITAGFDFEKGVFDMELVAPGPNGKIYKPLFGPVIFRREVTK